MHILEPFLDVIGSGDTTGPITGAALGSVEKFIRYRVLGMRVISFCDIMTHFLSDI